MQQRRAIRWKPCRLLPLQQWPLHPRLQLLEDLAALQLRQLRRTAAVSYPKVAWRCFVRKANRSSSLFSSTRNMMSVWQRYAFAGARVEVTRARLHLTLNSLHFCSLLQKNGDAVAARILSDFTTQFSAQLLASRIGSPDRMAAYPGGSEEAQADESFLATYSSFRQVLIDSGLTRVEPKATTTTNAASTAAALAAAIGGSSSRDLVSSPESSPPSTSLRSLPDRHSPPRPQKQFFAHLSSSAPQSRAPIHTAPASSFGFDVAQPSSSTGRLSITQGQAPGPSPAMLQQQGGPAPDHYYSSFPHADDYLPSWIADSTHDLHLLPLHTVGEMMPMAPGSGGVADDHMEAAQHDGADDGARAVPLLSSQESSSPFINTRGRSSMSPGAQLDEVQITMQ